jgi:hypothetical protein
MKVELFEVKYADRDAAKLVYREIVKSHEELGIAGYGLESYRTKSKRSRNRLKIIVAVCKNNAQNLPAILKTAQSLLVKHPLYAHLSFDSIATPLSQTKWNFDSYDDPNYQKIFIQKREKG